MERYHINPETGNPGICRAEVRCRYGGAAEHYTSKEEARAAFEKFHSFNENWLSSLKRSAGEAATTATCKACGAPVSRLDLAKALHAVKGTCSCGGSLARSRLKIGVRLESEKLFKLEEAKATTFFHATDRRGWGTAVNGRTPRFIHIGEREAAVDRALTKYRRFRAADNHVWAFYELRVRPEATMGKRLTDGGVDVAKKLKLGENGDYNPYVNRFEGPGTVSVVIPNTAVEIVGVRPVRSKELFEAASIYNEFEELNVRF